MTEALDIDDDRTPMELFGDISWWLENGEGDRLTLDRTAFAIILADWRAKKAEIEELKRDLDASEFARTHPGDWA